MRCYVITITRWRSDPRTGDPDVGAAAIVEPMALDPNDIAAVRSGHSHVGRRRWRSGWLRDDDLSGRLFFGGVKCAALVIETVANCTAKCGASEAADDSTARGIAMSAVIAYNCSS